MLQTHKRWAFLVVLVVAVVVAACQPAATPTPTPFPTSTPVPPTATTASTPETTAAATSMVTEVASAAATTAATSVVAAPTMASTVASTAAATSVVAPTTASTMAATAASTAMSTAASTSAVAPTVAPSTASTAAATAISTGPVEGTPQSTAQASGTAEATAASTAAVGNIIDVAKAGGNFTILLAALDKAGLTSTLEGTGPYTVFAPTDDAFKKLLTSMNMTETDLLNRPDLADILMYHVAPGKITTDNLQQYRSTDNPNQIIIPTLDGQQKLTATFDTDGKTVLLNGTAKITLANMSASNGVIDVIDTVLLPPTPSATAGATAESTAMSTAAATAASTAASSGSISFGPIEGTPNATLVSPATATGGS